MTPGLSIYLDLLRVLAASQVALYHLGWLPGVGLGAHWWNKWGHEAVVIFFVLSGFVIRHAVDTKERTFRQYAVSRISRLYTVIVPAIALTIVCDAIGFSIAPQLYENAGIDNPLIVHVMRLLISLLMLNESWWSIGLLTNAPYWSVCYEFWYYALFAAYVYAAGWQRLALLAGLSVVAGPHIMLLFPIWLLGSFAYLARPVTWPRALVWAAFAQMFAVIACHVAFDMPKLGVELLGADNVQNLFWSRFVISDAVLGVSFTLHLVAAKQLDFQLGRVLQPVALLVREGAARSFTLYLIHMPVMVMLAAVCAAIGLGPSPWLIAGGTLAIPLLLAPLIENQRHVVRPWLARLWAEQASAKPAAIGKVA
jgi:peptidoglycan/LPS O-acetylase OafA/YrhL